MNRDLLHGLVLVARTLLARLLQWLRGDRWLWVQRGLVLLFGSALGVFEGVRLFGVQPEIVIFGAGAGLLAGAWGAIILELR